ncbi:hypothetical protein FNO01nite_09630 [Flavobacterium noncentrifugens]|uniref:Tetratricopeptide repeat-containing protein n=1 Tax=Flavobacterium noncentrifugens TaxID=1128970 RepID=A0A1G8V0R1_9FLAO|nr:tetratricopeptide repeat protein [Flavobacterium noncentrifugens]GEP50291.1 hypothetical protein FNO01nite_09630 [Flavobacterium noncentrifugens]SDJ59559.1 Tetratricopeptide repeat-containing protein [Flavobacterium noncentrifugens]
MKYVYLVFLFVCVSTFAQQSFVDAEKQFYSGNYIQAQPLFEQFLKENPKHLKAIEYLGDIQSHLGNWEKASFYYQKLKSAKPNSANYQYKYGGALAMLAQNTNKFKALTLISDIESAFLQAVKSDPNHIEAHWALIEYYLQLPGIFGGSERKATIYANALSKISPVDGYLAKGCIAEYFERYTIAEGYYKKAIAIGNSKTTYQKLADLYKNKLHQPEKAKQVMDAFASKGS